MRPGPNYTVEGSEESQLLKQFNTQYGNGVATLDSLSKIYRNTPVVDTEKRRKTCWISTWRSITGSSASTSFSLWPILRRWLPFMRCTNGCRTTRGCSMKNRSDLLPDRRGFVVGAIPMLRA